MLISTIISTWSKEDARTEFNNLEKDIKNMGFYNFSKEFIVRCALLIYSKDVRFKINNLSQDCLNQFEAEWNQDNGIKNTIKNNCRGGYHPPVKFSQWRYAGDNPSPYR